MKTLLSAFACLLLPCVAVSFSTGARAADTMAPSKMDKMFVKKAAIGGMFEVETGKMAADMGASQGVKDFGNKMVEDHSKANDELKGIASSKSIDVPAALDADHQKMVDTLKGKTGADFDKLYLSDMKMAHKMDDKLFMKESSGGTDPDLKGFADKTDKVIKSHIAMLMDTMKSMK